MKTRNLFFALAVSVLALGFTACNKDDDQKGPAKEIAGSYKGDISLYGQKITQNVVVTIKYISDNAVSISLKDTVLVLPVNINCNATVTVDSEDATRFNVVGNTTFKYTIPGAPAGTPAVDLPVVVAGVVNKYTYSPTGTVLDITVGNEQIGAMAPEAGFPLTVTYIGNKQ